LKAKKPKIVFSDSARKDIDAILDSKDKEAFLGVSAAINKIAEGVAKFQSGESSKLPGSQIHTEITPELEKQIKLLIGCKVTGARKWDGAGLTDGEDIDYLLGQFSLNMYGFEKISGTMDPDADVTLKSVSHEEDHFIVTFISEQKEIVRHSRYLSISEEDTD
jgi:hypothetical protein